MMMIQIEMSKEFQKFENKQLEKTNIITFTSDINKMLSD